MSKTLRNDSRNQERTRKDAPFMGTVYRDDTPEWKFTRDKKPHSKSSKAFKKAKESERRAQRDQELRNLNAGNIDPEDVNLPRQPKTNDWEWN